MSSRHRVARRTASASAAPADMTRHHPASTPFPRRKPRTSAQELASLGRVRESQAVRERASVAAARAEGMTWQDIADALRLPLTTVYRQYRP